MNPPPLIPRDDFGIFVGPINQDTAHRIVAAITPITAPGPHVITAHILFQSFGGSIADGIFLYHFLRSLPRSVVLYNGGTIQSIASLVFLGAHKRVASARSTFLLHRSATAPQAASASRLKTLTESIALDDRNTESIYRDHLTLPEELWKRLDYDDLILSAEDAMKYGLVDEIGDFTPDRGAVVACI